MSYQHKRGVIRESAVKAMVHDPLFRHRVEKSKKGKGSFKRKDKHKTNYGSYDLSTFFKSLIHNFQI